MKQHRDHSQEQDDATLVASVLAGERDAFDVLLQRYAASVQRLCTTLLLRPQQRSISRNECRIEVAQACELHRVLELSLQI